VAAVLAQLLFAQLTLALTIAFWVTGKISRWRPRWLAAAAAAGALWALVTGAGRAAAGFAAGPAQVARYLAGAYGSPGRLLHLSPAFAGYGHWLPGQLPVALVAAAAETAGLSWLSRPQPGRQDGRQLPPGWLPPGWLPDGGPGSQPGRPGLAAAAARRYSTASIRSGGIVTRDGGCVGLDEATGRRAVISWPEAERGVLCAGADRAALTETGFQLACAAIRRRKAVIAIDLTGTAQVARSAVAACAASQAPLACFGDPGTGWSADSPGDHAVGRDQPGRRLARAPLTAGGGCYEPARCADPARAASLVLAMIDWAGVSEQHRRACGDYLAAVFGVLAAAPAAPAASAGRRPVLDDAVRLLDPAELRSRATRIPAYHPHAELLARRISSSASLAEAELTAIAAITTQLPRLRGSALGHWLRPARTAAAAGMPALSGRAGLAGRGDWAGGELAIDLGQAVRDRAVVLFSLDRGVHRRAASMIARLAVADILAVLDGLREMSVRCDSLIWVNGCEVLDRRQAAGLISLGSRTGAAVVLGTSSAPAAAVLAAQAGVVLVRGPADSALGQCLTGQPGPFPAAGAGGAVASAAAVIAAGPLGLRASDCLGGSLADRDRDSLALLVRGPRGRLLPSCRAVPAAGGAW
jgi:hypothetical protein